MSNKLTIQSEMAALDRKDRDFYDSLTDEERKKFAVFLMIRYGSAVKGDADLQAYYLMATNKRLNKNFFSIPTKHAKLQWLLATTISPGIGNQYHEWISTKKKDSSNSKALKFLKTIHPDWKMDEVELLAKISTTAELKQLARDMGMTPEQIKKELG